MPALHLPSHTLAPLVSAFLSLVLMHSTGCRRGAPESDGSRKKEIRVAICADSLVNPMRNYQCTLLERLIRTRPGMDVSLTNAHGDATVQLQHVRDAVARRADFLMVFPEDSASLIPTLRDAVAQGVRVFAFSSDIPEDACTHAIFTDDRRLGQLAGDFILAALRTKARSEGRPEPTGRVVLLRGDESSASCTQRAEGFLQAIAKAPGVILVHDAPCNWNEEDAAARIQEALRLQKQFDVICAQNDSIALGAAKAIRETSGEMRENMLIIGTDGVPGKGAGVDMVIRGDQEATIYHPPLVDLAWRKMQAMLDQSGSERKKHHLVKPFIITQENAPKLQQAGIPAPDVE